MTNDTARITAAAVTGLLVGLSAGCGTRGIASLADRNVVHATEPAALDSAAPAGSSGGKMSCTPAMMGSAAPRSSEKMACSAEMMRPTR